MVRREWPVLSIVALASWLAAPASAQREELVARGAVWRYLDDGSDPGTAWRGLAFADASWRAGRAELGYGDGDEATVVSAGPSPFFRSVTTYFRHAFELAEPHDFVRLHLHLLRDDGAVVYLNGTEVARSNLLPLISIDADTLAFDNVTGDDEEELHPFSFSADLLRAGRNVLAVELHQSSPFSSDVSFDLELHADTRVALVRGPYLQQGTSSAMTVRWRTDVPSVGRVWYGSAPAQLDGVASEAASTTDHAVTLTGLAPATRVHYAVGHGTQRLAGDDAQHAFVTAPPPGTPAPTRVWVLGDSGTASAEAAAVRDAYLAFTGTRHTDLWLMLGDNAYSSGTDAEYQAAVFEMYPEMLRQSALWSTRGNHEQSASTYFSIFTLPRNGEAGGLPSGTEAYYSFDHANVHFLCLDSFASNPFPGGAMWRWLEGDLAATDQDWIVAFWHHPPYTKGSHDSDLEPDLIKMRAYFLPLLEDGGVDLVLAGHSHSYERSFLIDGHYDFSFQFDDSHLKDDGDGRESGDGAYRKAPIPHAGTVYCVAGSSGHTSGGDLDHPAMFYSAESLGSLVLDVAGDRLDVSFLNAGGLVEDGFTLRKHPERGLTADTTTLSVTSGGAQHFALDAGPAHAGKWYVLLGSLSGTEPGFAADSVRVPLVPDAYTRLTIARRNSALLQHSLGRFDAAGRAAVTLNLPPGLPPSLAGTTLFHAFLVLDVPGSGDALLASNPFPLTLIP